MIARTILISAIACAVSSAAVRSGKAEADWVSASGICEAGKPLQTAVRLVVDDGWHTYWINPGEGGMKISVKWELPDGWVAGELEHPVPKRFMTGELPGFGYEGTVIFPVKFTPPADFKGAAKLKGKVSWLTCNEASCVPGNAELELSVESGQPQTAAEGNLIAEALWKIPRPAHAGSLKVLENEKTLLITIESPDKGLDPNEYEIFPATSQVIDSAAKFRFSGGGTHWTAEVPKSEYATKAIKELTLVLAGKAKQPPISLTWKAE